MVDKAQPAPRWRHKKRGTEYVEVGRAALQVSGELPSNDATIVIYQGDDGRLWARPKSEFEDGRFERVAPPAPDATPAQPVSAAGSEPAAWRCRKSSWERPGWVITTLPDLVAEHDIVEPLYTTPTPALAPQDGGLRAAAQQVVTDWWDDEDNPSSLKDLRAALAAPSDPDVLPGLKLALEILKHPNAGMEPPDGGDPSQADRVRNVANDIRAEIAASRRSGGRDVMNKPTNEQRYYDALKRIVKDYMTTDQLRRKSEKNYGLGYEECLEMAYENIQVEAATAIKGKRRSK